MDELKLYIDHCKLASDTKPHPSWSDLVRPFTNLEWQG
jgi:hypothetical protein